MIYVAIVLIAINTILFMRYLVSKMTEKYIAYMPDGDEMIQGYISPPTILELWDDPDVGSFFRYKDKFGLKQSRPSRKLNLITEEEHTTKMLE